MRICCIIVGFLCGAGMFALQAEEIKSTTELEQSIFQKVNDIRLEKGLPALVYSDSLAKLAQAHSVKMAAKRQLSHDGFEQRFTDAQKEISGVNAMAENVAMNFPQNELAADTVKNWMNSPVHRANILRPMTLTGVGVVRGADGTYYFTQIFVKK